MTSGDVSVASRAASWRPPRAAVRPFWETGYTAALVLIDGICITAASALALWWRFNQDGNSFTTTRLTTGVLHDLSYTLVLGAVTPVWVLMLALGRAYEPRFVGVGSEEFKRVFTASLRMLALIAIGALVLKAELSRLYVATMLVTGVLLLLGGRYFARKALHRLRMRGHCVHRVVAVGSKDEVEHLVRTLKREPYAGLMVVAASLPDYETVPPLDGEADLPVLGPARSLAGRLETVQADTVAVVGTSALSSRELREFAWDLEGTGVDLVVAPSLTDVSGPRIHIRPVAGLPLLHLEEPTFGGARRAVKSAIDVVAGSLLTIALLIPGLLIAILIKRDSPGPVFYRQERVGKDGEPFRIWKFRTMRVGADAELASLQALNEHDGPLFKMRQDPRITRVGAVLRKYSLDEIPQILNVLTGSMSLVGPRPPLPGEVDQYAEFVHRRLLVKPGMTGLWQVSGRSDLDWNEAVRLDLYYVENWSVALDAMILWKTLFAVLRGSGAY